MESGKVNVKARTCQWLFGCGIIHQSLFHILAVSCLTPVHKMAGNNAILRDHFLNFNVLLCSDHGWHSNQLKWRGLLKGIEAQHGSRTTVWSSKIWKLLPLICSYRERNFISNWLWIGIWVGLGQHHTFMPLRNYLVQGNLEIQFWMRRYRIKPDY